VDYHYGHFPIGTPLTNNALDISPILFLDVFVESVLSLHALELFFPVHLSLLEDDVRYFWLPISILDGIAFTQTQLDHLVGNELQIKQDIAMGNLYTYDRTKLRGAAAIIFITCCVVLPSVTKSSSRKGRCCSHRASSVFLFLGVFAMAQI